MTGTGYGAMATFSNVGSTGGPSIRCRMRRVSAMQGIDRDPVDFTDLETLDVLDIRPADLQDPGTFELEWLADPAGEEQYRPSSAEVASIVTAKNADFTLTIVLPGNHGTITSKGYVSSYDGPDLEVNVPMEHRATWQSRGQTTWN